jgi:PAS domain S-box-containing protein
MSVREAARAGRRRDQVFKALHEVALAAAGMLEAEPLAQLVVDAACELLGVEDAVLRWLDPEAGVIRLLASNDRNPMAAELGLGEGMVGEVIQTSRPLRVNDYQAWARDKNGLSRPDTVAALFVPLTVRDRNVGGLGVISYRDHVFSEEDEQVLGLLAAQIAPSIDAALLYAEAGRRARRQEALAGFGRLAVAGAATQDLLERATAILDEHLPSGSGAEIQLAESGAWLSLRTGPSAESVVDTTPVSAAGGLTIELARPKGMSAEDVDFLASVANVLGEALERQRAEQRLRQAEERQRQAAGLMREAVSRLSAFIGVRDAEGTFLFANTAYASFFGTTPEKMEGSNLADYWSPKAVARALVEDRRTIRGGKPVHSPQAAFETLDGRIKHFAYSRFPIQLQEGRPAVLIVAQDIDDKLLVEAAREESEAKSRFLAMMSHELRTPLNSVLGFGQLLQQESIGPLNERQRRYVDHITSSGRHLLELINDVLDLSKIQSGRMELHVVQVGLPALLGDISERVQPLAAARGVELSVDCAPGLEVSADPRRLEQVILNLLSNAIRFTPEGGRVTVAARLDGDGVLIEVADTGVGIPADMHDRVFDEFTQVDSGSRRSQDGTGLGLALTRSLLKMMRGTISLESEVGKGTTFSVRLPAS